MGRGDTGTRGAGQSGRDALYNTKAGACGRGRGHCQCDFGGTSLLHNDHAVTKVPLSKRTRPTGGRCGVRVGTRDAATTGRKERPGSQGPPAPGLEVGKSHLVWVFWERQLAPLPPISHDTRCQTRDNKEHSRFLSDMIVEIQLVSQRKYATWICVCVMGCNRS